MNTHKISPSWKIHFSLTRTHAAKRQAQDLLLLSARNAAHDTAVRPAPRLPFNPPNKPDLSNVGLFTWKRGECAFDKGVEKIFIYTPSGLPVDTAHDEIEAAAKVDRLNNAVRDAGVRRFATGSKYSVKG